MKITFVGPLILLLLVGYGGIHLFPGQAQTTEPINIVATSSIVADAVSIVGGSQVRVSTLIPLGVDLHDFEPTPSDLIKINSSDYIFWIGGGAEESLVQLLTYWQARGQATALIEQVNQTQLHIIKSGGQEHIDPHFWMDPLLWAQAVESIARVLTSLRPQETSFEHNAQAYISQLQQLNQGISTKVAQIPTTERFLVTQHESLFYFARRYNFTTRALQGISTEAEPGVQEIDQLAQFIVQQHVRVVFTESTTPSDQIEAVLDAARVQGQPVVVGGRIYVGSLGSDAQSNTYLKFMAYNTNTIVGAILQPPTTSTHALDFNAWFLALPLLVLPYLRKWRKIQS